jgi:ABC-2 type transport system ATP-binding protein
VDRQRVEGLEGALRVQVVDSVVRVHLRGSRGVLPRVVARAEAGGFTITDLSVTEPTLEAVFINLTGKDLRE